MAKNATTIELMNVFEFESVDLATNRDLKLSRQQLERLRKLRLTSIIFPIALDILLVGGFITTTFSRQSSRYIDSSSIFLLGCIVVITAIVILQWGKLSQDIANKHVKSIQGHIETGDLETRNIGFYGTGFRVTVNGVSFIVPSTARKFLISGKTYKFYYLPNSKIIMSVDINH